MDPGADTNRTVYTFAGGPEEVAEAALAAARAARSLIDMRRHSGAHPRLGALDVCPFVPVRGATMEDCVLAARSVAERMARELDVPVYLYEAAASRPERKSLADIRQGEYEGLEAKLKDSEWAPDFGPARFDARWGATVVGAREFLIAYNVNLNTRDRKLAQEIALSIREQGRSAKGPDGAILRDEKGNAVKIPGRLPRVRAIGWYIEEYRCAQVSINLTDYHVTPLHAVYETVREEAEKLGLLATGSEVVGLVPLEPLTKRGASICGAWARAAAPERRSLWRRRSGPWDSLPCRPRRGEEGRGLRHTPRSPLAGRRSVSSRTRWLRIPPRPGAAPCPPWRAVWARPWPRWWPT